jgi:hypothetical protein
MTLEEHCLYAWVGEDEHGSGRIGLKQGHVPAGFSPLVTMDYDAHKIQRPEVVLGLEAQAAVWGKKIRLVRFRFDAVIDETEHGE